MVVPILGVVVAGDGGNPVDVWVVGEFGDFLDQGRVQERGGFVDVALKLEAAAGSGEAGVAIHAGHGGS